MVDDGNGAITVTYSGTVAGSSGFDVALGLIPVGRTCPQNDFPDPMGYLVFAGPLNPNDPVLGASPATVTAGSRMYSSIGPSAMLPAADYVACLYTFDRSQQVIALVSSVSATIGEVAPSTTAAPIATTIAGNAGTGGGDPVTPAFTG